MVCPLGRENTSAIIEGTPDGFRMLAKFLVTMADSVETGDAQDNERHLSLSPDDNNRLTSTPSRDRKDVKRPTYWSLGLDGVNLELALETDGRVVGIGRYIWDLDDEPVWYAPPQRYHSFSQADPD